MDRQTGKEREEWMDELLQGTEDQYQAERLKHLCSEIDLGSRLRSGTDGEDPIDGCSRDPTTSAACALWRIVFHPQIQLLRALSLNFLPLL